MIEGVGVSCGRVRLWRMSVKGRGGVLDECYTVLILAIRGAMVDSAESNNSNSVVVSYSGNLQNFSVLRRLRTFFPAGRARTPPQTSR